MKDQELEVVAKAISAFRALDAEQQNDCLEMTKIVLDPAVDKTDKYMSMNTMEFILFPSNNCEFVAKKIEAIPAKHRLRWCESAGPCACMGCANQSGVTKSEWRRWGKSKGYKLSAWGNLLQVPDGEEGETDTFSVRLRSVPDTMKKIAVIRTLRELFDLSLVAAKAAVDHAPAIIAQDIPRERAERAKFRLESAGAVIDLG